MKLVVLTLLFIFSTVKSVPADTEEVQEGTEEVPVGMGEVQEGTEEVPVSMGEVPEGMEEVPEDIEGLLGDMLELLEGPEDNTTIDLDGDGTKPDAHFVEEVKAYFKQQKKKLSNRVARHTEEALFHGDTIALQTFIRSRWLGCPGLYCGAAICPLMLMMGSDWNNCWGEVFRIYRASGPGAVRVGDLVGLYYPRDPGRWLGCPGAHCAKATCPGIPSFQHGFATSELWYRCWGEVFRIYARGKSFGAPINSDDDVVLYYLQQGLWVAQGDGPHSVKLPCLGTSRPPPLHRYDPCPWETFRVWKREY